MLILLAVVCVFLIWIGFAKYEDFLVFMGGSFLLIVMGCIAVCGGSIINHRTIEAKIAMYTEENASIEEQMNSLVERYMHYESDTYGSLKGESSITLISLYPELKANALVEKQIEVYIANNEKIKELKNDLLSISNYKWWVYFGE